MTVNTPRQQEAVPNSAHTAFMQRLQFHVRDVGKHHRHAASITEPCDGIERDAIVCAVRCRLHNHGAVRADPLLQASIVLHAGVRLHA